MDGDGSWGAAGLLAAFAGEIRSLDVSELDPGGLDEVVASTRLVERAAAGLLVRAAQRADALSAAGAGPGPEGTLSGDGEVSAATVRAETARAAVAGTMPSFAAALAAGAVGAGHLDALARALGQATDAERAALTEREAGLLTAAERLSVDSFSRHLSRVVRQLREQLGTSREPVEPELRLWEGRDGIGRMAGSFDPETFERIRAEVEAEMAALCRQTDNAAETADGLVEPVALDARLAARALLSRLTSGGMGGPVGRPSITLVVDAATLLDGSHPGTVCETGGGMPVPVAAAHRCACDAVIRKVVIDKQGVPIDVGRRFRTATDAQWAALRTLYTGCAWYGCDRPLSWCQAHHVVYWTPPHNGPTDLANLVPLCSRHHHLAHEGGWQLLLDPDRALRHHQPDGTPWRITRPDRLAADRRRPLPADGGAHRAGCPPPADTTTDRAHGSGCPPPADSGWAAA